MQASSLLGDRLLERLRAADALAIRDVLAGLVDSLDAPYAGFTYDGSPVDFFGDAQTAPQTAMRAERAVPHVVVDVPCRDRARRDVGIGKVRLLSHLPTGVVVVVGPEFRDDDVVDEVRRAVSAIERVLAAAYDRGA